MAEQDSPEAERTRTPHHPFRLGRGVVLLDDSTLALTGVILQVLGLHVALLNVLLGAAGLVVKLVSKDLPRSSDKDDPGHST